MQNNCSRSRGNMVIRFFVLFDNINLFNNVKDPFASYKTEINRMIMINFYHMNGEERKKSGITFYWSHGP